MKRTRPAEFDSDSELGNDSRRVRLYTGACAVLAVFAFTFCRAAGNRGIFLEDQSIVFDGGWRILQGQVPYRDFFMPYTPATLYVQALFFKIFGVNWGAMVLPAALLNAAAALSAVRIVRLLTGDLLRHASRWLALGGGLATAVCFAPPFGTLWFDQTAMFFDLLALQFAVESLVPGRRGPVRWLAASGAALAVAILSKQNFGTFFVPIPFAVALAGRKVRGVQFFAALRPQLAGVIGVATVSCAVLLLAGSFGAFVHQTVELAGALGRQRVGGQQIARILSLEGPPNAIQADVPGCLAGGLMLLLAWFNRKLTMPDPARHSRVVAAAAVTFLLPVFRSATQVSTDNEWQNDVAFLGLGICLGLGVFLSLGEYVSVSAVSRSGVNLHLPPVRKVTIAICTAIALWSTVVVSYVGWSAWTRKVQQFENGSQFDEAVRIPGLEGLVWGEPTRTSQFSGTNWRSDDLANLIAWLAPRRSHFFVIGGSSVLYGLLKVPSPQPVLYFSEGVSYSHGDVPVIDPLIRASLERNRVTVVIREKFSWTVQEFALRSFEHTWDWFTKSFRHTRDFGNFEVWEKDEDEAGTR